MNAALETLMLVFSAEDGLAVPPRALFLGAEPHPDLRAWPEITGWQPFKPKVDAWNRAGFHGDDRLPTGKWPLVLILPGKSKDETLAWFSIARDRLSPGGVIVVAMTNTTGAGRFEKELAKATGGVTSIQKHKCRAFHATENGTWDEELFSAWRKSGERRFLPGTDYTVEAGIFSSDHVDPGSQLLADLLPAHLRGEVADLGAGWGFLSDAVLKRCPRIDRLDLYEADSRALDCARLNLAGHSAPETKLESPVCDADERPKVEFHWHDVKAGLPRVYDTIIMNPPFHSGQATDVDLGRAFLKTAAASLKRGGKLLLVANRQLPYEATLEALGFSWRKTAEDKIYKILSADKR